MLQMRDAILKGAHPVNQEESIKFAAFQCQIQFGDHVASKHKSGFLEWEACDYYIAITVASPRFHTRNSFFHSVIIICVFLKFICMHLLVIVGVWWCANVFWCTLYLLEKYYSNVFQNMLL